MGKVLSVVVPAYNVEQYLGEALESCLIDAMDSLEVLVVVDGSKDKSLLVAQKYESRYPSVFRAIYKENGGYGSVVNLGIQEAEGRYFKVLDGDDWFNPQSLESIVGFLGEATDDLIACQMEFVYQESGEHKIVDECRPLKPWLSNPVCDIEGCVTMHSFVYRTELLRACGINLPSHCLYTDTILVSLAFDKAETVYYRPEVLYRYRLDRPGQSIDISSKLSHLEDVELVLDCLMDELDRTHEINSMVGRQCLAIVESHYRFICEHSREKKESIKRFNGMLRKHDWSLSVIRKNVRIAKLANMTKGNLGPDLVCLFAFVWAR